MTLWKIYSLSVGLTLMAASSGVCDIVVSPEFVESGDPLTITATVDGATVAEPPVKIECNGKSVNVNAVFDKATGKITFDAPQLETSGKCKISVGAFTKEIRVYSRVNPYIREAVLWKKQKLSDTVILGHISQLATRDMNQEGVSPPVFDGVSIKGNGINELRDNGFSEDFIAKFEGQPQWVTLGMAAIFLPDGGKITTAPLLRIMLEPKSYYKPRYSFGNMFSCFKSDTEPKCLSVWREKFDVNIGYTVISTKSNGENTNFLLTGFSYEINPAALLNFGAAIPTGSVDDKSVKAYLGITVDQNFLKAIGFME